MGESSLEYFFGDLLVGVGGIVSDQGVTRGNCTDLQQLYCEPVGGDLCWGSCYLICRMHLSKGMDFRFRTCCNWVL